MLRRAGLLALLVLMTAGAPAVARAPSPIKIRALRPPVMVLHGQTSLATPFAVTARDQRITFRDPDFPVVSFRFRCLLLRSGVGSSGLCSSPGRPAVQAVRSYHCAGETAVLGTVPRRARLVDAILSGHRRLPARVVDTPSGYEPRGRRVFLVWLGRGRDLRALQVYDRCGTPLARVSRGDDAFPSCDSGLRVQRPFITRP